MKNSNFRTYCSFLLISIVITSCVNREGDWGATIGDCDEICTVYYAAQIELMKDKELYDRDFTNKQLRRKHVIEIKNGHKIEN
ncbi:MAG: hypothetical protein K9J13_00135 [Saprospiraceae bacterium]|nr:hypothetical protein [Saprospiraceae bacterium]